MRWSWGYLLVLAVMAACTKDHPDDIPGWVEGRIKHCKQPFRDCHGLIVQEHGGLGKRWFYFREESGADELYTEDAALHCSGTNIFVDEEQCTTVVLDSLHPVRTIWVEG